MNPTETSELRKLKWLPILDQQAALILRAPNQCRGLKDKLLVSSQLPVLDMYISTDWEIRLGWHLVIPKHVLLGQLSHGIKTRDRAIIDAILTYIVEKKRIDQDQLVQDLGQIPCILTGTGLYSTASKCFPPWTSRMESCDRLHPYLGNVDNKFWLDHEILMKKMNICDAPSLANLLDVQKILQSKLPLDDSDVAVAVETLRLASRFPTDSLADLKVLSKAGDFCLVQDINYDDLGALIPKEEVSLTHPDVPFQLAKRLGIELLSERLMKGMLEIADIDDEDEFEQQEDVSTRITNTLGRYPIETTFREYLANADDTPDASKISWLLDDRTHSGGKLLTPELGDFQGPALLVHNDGG